MTGVAATRETLTERAQELAARREPFVRATVVRAQHPTSAHAGDTALVNANGDIDGFVGGNCVEASVREYGPADTLHCGAAPAPRRARRTVPRARRGRRGGLEPLPQRRRDRNIPGTPATGAPGARRRGDPHRAGPGDTGSGLGLDIELTTGTAAEPQADDAAFIVASHGKDEEPALVAALAAGVPYVALVASEVEGPPCWPPSTSTRSSAHACSARPGWSWAPAPRARSRCRSWPSWSPSGPGTDRRSPHRRFRTAIDPVCGMTVAAVESTIHIERDGVTTYFCSDGCRTSFLAHPEQYAVAS